MTAPTGRSSADGLGVLVLSCAPCLAVAVIAILVAIGNPLVTAAVAVVVAAGAATALRRRARAHRRPATDGLAPSGSSAGQHTASLP